MERATFFVRSDNCTVHRKNFQKQLTSWDRPHWTVIAPASSLLLRLLLMLPFRFNLSINRSEKGNALCTRDFVNGGAFRSVAFFGLSCARKARLTISATTMTATVTIKRLPPGLGHSLAANCHLHLAPRQSSSSSKNIEHSGFEKRGALAVLVAGNGQQCYLSVTLAFCWCCCAYAQRSKLSIPRICSSTRPIWTLPPHCTIT